MRNKLMQSVAFAIAIGVAAGCATMTAAAPTATSPHIVAAVADKARPQDATFDPGCIGAANACVGVKLDAFRKPADMLAFAGVTPGMKIGELIPGQGYMTRLFSKAVGPTGAVHVFAGAPREGQPQPIAAIQGDKANYPNVDVTLTDFATINTPEPLDLVWTSQNYHDMHNPGRNLDINAANKAVYNALKPGGVYIVLDHATAPGTPFNAQLHRIDPDMVKKEVLAAGFEFVGESNVLRNTADPHDKGVFDDSIRHRTDQFIMKFKRPA